MKITKTKVKYSKKEIQEIVANSLNQPDNRDFIKKELKILAKR